MFYLTKNIGRKNNEKLSVKLDINKDSHAAVSRRSPMVNKVRSGIISPMEKQQEQPKIQQEQPKIIQQPGTITDPEKSWSFSCKAPALIISQCDCFVYYIFSRWFPNMAIT